LLADIAKHLQINRPAQPLTSSPRYNQSAADPRVLFALEFI
jgi:hypothetical protein